jgi:hypothetical protein
MPVGKVTNGMHPVFNARQPYQGQADTGSSPSDHWQDVRGTVTECQRWTSVRPRWEIFRVGAGYMEKDGSSSIEEALQWV